MTLPQPPALLATTPIYLLFRDEQAVHWSLDRDVLERTLDSMRASGFSFANNGVVELALPALLAAKLESLSCPDYEPPHRWDTFQLAQVARETERERVHVQSKPPHMEAEGLRAYVVFLTNGACRWSPSGNNINSIVARAPEQFLCKALRVALTEDQYCGLNGFFMWACDNF